VTARSTEAGDEPNLLMVSGDIGVSVGRQGVFYETLRHLSRHFGRIDVLCPRVPGAAPRTVHGNVFVHPSPSGRALQPLFVTRKGRELAGERRYGLIVSHDYGVFYNGVAAWWLARATGIPYVSEIHHVEGYPRAATARERIYRQVAKLYIRWVWRRAEAIRTVNAVELPNLFRSLGVPQEKILVLPSLYLDPEVFRPLPDEPKRFDVLLIGRLVPNKGIGTLLDALAVLTGSHPGLRACILGEGPQRSALEARLEQLGLGRHVELVERLPSASDVARLINQARMLVCASTAEGGPRVTVEAMACGVPVITTPVGVMRELVEDGVNGFLFDWDAEGLAERIERLLADEQLRHRAGEAGQHSVRGFDAATVVGAYAAAYKAIARAARA
jgi:glycosyltransferase involved in cell wall biosynthesis